MLLLPPLTSSKGPKSSGATFLTPSSPVKSCVERRDLVWDHFYCAFDSIVSTSSWSATILEDPELYEGGSTGSQVTGGRLWNSMRKLEQTTSTAHLFALASSHALQCHPGNPTYGWVRWVVKTAYLTHWKESYFQGKVGFLALGVAGCVENESWSLLKVHEIKGLLRFSWRCPGSLWDCHPDSHFVDWSERSFDYRYKKFHL